MTNSDQLPSWEKDRANICLRIERQRSPIKVLLKTKNSSLFIERWIDHHAKIVGIENLIIFDNMSTDQEVLSVYHKYRDCTEIVRFADVYYNLHNTGLYRDLYSALAKSSQYFVFLDEDEFLVLIDNDRYFQDDCIVSFVMNNRHHDLFPATWLWNANWSPRQFNCRNLGSCLACGKPLIRSDTILPRYVNHNFQLGPRAFFPPFKTNLFVLHLAYLSPQQRILSNMNKLIVEGIAQAGESPASIAARSNDITKPIFGGYAREIRSLLALDKNIILGERPLPAGCFELSLDGNIRYYSDQERAALNDLTVRPRQAYDAIPTRYGLGGDTAIVRGRPLSRMLVQNFTLSRLRHQRPV